MNNEIAAKIFAELGNSARLDIFQLLIRSGSKGLSIGEIHARLDIPLSTLAFHLRGLVGAMLIEQEKHGRSVICRARYEMINDAIGFLKKECCTGVDQVPVRQRQRA